MQPYKRYSLTGTPSARTGIVEGCTMVFTGACGLARLNPPVPSTVEMKYGVSPISKQLIAAAVMLLMECSMLRLDDLVATWFPELAIPRKSCCECS